ncbi:transcription factor domain-containing protein [Aspergillus alliaceus]|uniref:transcription factor domain-containing protein n=1 Tax=Petromyces alliaceus TaxID=209559 RepID=UPI0012A3B373|nr:fungal-specific transcription factor domain-containing protein [Aspergillus alliaceus]KAB8233880.1 fungal-specific transcription factor domain-containing protein [Aspergillus alliaceus]
MNTRKSAKPQDSAKATDRPSKRRKVAVACDECRARKIRCDGVQPVCGPCRKKADLGVRCVYTGEHEKKRAVQDYIASLESRIKNLESPGDIPARITSVVERERTGRFQSSTSPYSPVSSRNLPAVTQLTTSSAPENYSPLTNDTPESANRDDHLPPCSACRSSSERIANCVHERAKPRSQGFEERPTQGFFGSSSAASFMHQIKMAVDKTVASPHRQTSDTVPGVTSSPALMETKQQRPSSIQSYVLPPRKTADSLMGIYWTFVFPLYPLVDNIRLRADYEKIWTGEPLQSDENMLMCTFNMIFALSCQLADFIPHGEREVSADAFFSQAKDLLQFNIWDAGSAALIQCLLLMAQYLQSTDSAHQCWIVTGLAIRNAQSLGLHLPQTIARLPSPQDQQLARKIWHGCVLMDRVISMTFGRPAMITKASCGSVPLPDMVDEEYIPTASGIEATQPADRPSVMAFYARSLGLYEIMNDILLSLYKPVPEDNPEDMYELYFNKETSEDEQTIFELDRALTKWSRSLPQHLRGSSLSDSTDVVFYHQSVVLRARFLHVRMLLFRPILSKYCTARDTKAPDTLVSRNDSFPQRIAWQWSTICVQVAQEVIELIHGNIPADGSAGPLPAWWYNILYVYTAATVLVAGYLCPTILDEVTEVAVTRSWHCALEILRKYQSYSTSARRCIAALEILYERVVSVPPPSHALSTSHQPPGSTSNTVNDMSLGEGIDAIFSEGFDWPDFQDMSWLNSVPSSLHYGLPNKAFLGTMRVL